MQSMLRRGRGCVLSLVVAVDVVGTCAMFCVSTDGIVPKLTRYDMKLIFNTDPWMTLTFTGASSTPEDSR